MYLYTYLANKTDPASETDSFNFWRYKPKRMLATESQPELH